MSDFLKDLDQIYNEVKDQEQVYENLPDGEYLATIEGVKYGDSAKGLPMVTMVFSVTHGEYAGKQHRKFLMLSGDSVDRTRQNIHRYVTEVKKLGIDTSGSLESTFSQFGKLEGLTVKLKLETTISKTTKKAFLNTSIELV